MPYTKKIFIMKRITLSNLCLLLITFLSFEATAQTKVDMIDKYLNRTTKDGFSGVALVAHKGKIIFAKGYGLANREKNLKFDKNSVFDIGSITKQFTGAAIMKLEMQGKLKTSDKMSKYLPGTPKHMQKVTLHHLLTHSAGLPGSIGDDDEVLNKKAFLKEIFKRKLKSSYGKYSYSNVGYSLLAIVVEEISGMSYEQFLQKNIFKPAGMTQTGYTLPKWNNKNLVIGYKDKARWGTTNVECHYDQGVTYNLRGNGGIMSTVLDMHKWYEAIKNNTVLSKEAIKKYIGKQIKSGGGYYGYGWGTEAKPGREITWHNGGNGFFDDFMGYYLKEDLMIMVACNYGEASDPYAHQIDRIIHGEFKAMDDKIAAQYAGEYALPSGKKFNVRFSADNQLVLPVNAAELFTLFSGSADDNKAIADDYSRKIQELSNTLLKEDYAAYGKIEHQYVPGMTETAIEKQMKGGLTRFRTMMGALKSVKVLGSVARRGGKYYLTAVKLAFDKGNKYFFHTWKGKELIDMNLYSESGMTKKFDYKGGKKFVARSNKLSIELTSKNGQPALKVGGKMVLKKLGAE